MQSAIADRMRNTPKDGPVYNIFFNLTLSHSFIKSNWSVTFEDWCYKRGSWKLSQTLSKVLSAFKVRVVCPSGFLSFFAACYLVVFCSELVSSLFFRLIIADIECILCFLFYVYVSLCIHRSGVGRFPSPKPKSVNYFSCFGKFRETSPVALCDGQNLMSLVVSAKDGSFSRPHPKFKKSSWTGRYLHLQIMTEL